MKRPHNSLKSAFWLHLGLFIFALAGTCLAQEASKRMEELVQPFADAQVFMGSVLVAQHGKVLFDKSYGYADLEWNVPNSFTTRFNIASITKQFTAAAILLLEERGKLKTDDFITKYLPDAPSPWDKITIYNLLTHTSGISDDAAKYTPGTPDSLALLNKPLRSQPGEKYFYVDTGYLVLGYLIERISGQTYTDFVQENIFKPLGMNDSGMFSFVTVTPRRAAGYWPGSYGIENAERPDARIGFSSGSLYSSTEDLLRWETALFGGKLLSPASLQKMTTPFRSNYACGLQVNRVNGKLVIEHGGNNIGFNAHLAYYPEDQLTVAVLANLNGTVVGKIASALAAVAHGEAVTLAPPLKAITIAPEVLDSYAGTYQFPNYTVTMKPEGNHLVADFDDGARIIFFAESATKFFDKTWGIELEFSKDENGKSIYVTRRQEEKNETGKKE